MIAILDYGSGNLRSAQRACESTGRTVVITRDFEIAMQADGLIVPGVVAYASCMAGLVAIQGDEIIRKRRELERPTLGICVGMQILFSQGSERSRDSAVLTPGVGLWPGEVSRLKADILPHMGWNSVETNPASVLFAGVENESFYFVHSYAAKESVGQLTTWGTYGEKFVAAVEDGSLSATQFHPEKSGKAGLKLLKNWAHSL